MHLNDYPQKTVPLKELMVNAGATSHIIKLKVIKKFKRYDDTFQSENHHMELTDGTKTSGIELKRDNSKIRL